MIQDLLSSLRGLRARPTWSALAVLTLALGIGFAVAIFAVVDATLLAPLPFPRPGELVRVWETNPHSGRFDASEPNFLDLAREAETVQLAAFKPARFDLTADGLAERLAGGRVSAGLFDTLGVAPALGRSFTAAEDLPGGEPVAVLSDELWRRSFGSSAEILDRSVVLDGRSYRVVGVLPEGFDLWAAEIFVPLAANAAGARGDRWLALLGRLRGGESPAAAGAELAALTDRLAERFPATNTGWGIDIAPLASTLVPEDFRRRSLLLLAGAGLLLLTGCVNVAHLLLARGRERRAEMAVRRALGAGRGRIVRQLLVESALLSTSAAALGALIAAWLIEVVRWLEPVEIPRLASAGVGGRTLAFCALLAILTSLVSGLMPALRGSAGAPREDLGGGRLGGRSESRLRGWLIAAELAFATLLLVSASLVGLSFWKLSRVETGLRTADVLSIPLRLPDETWSWGQRGEAVSAAVAALAEEPGVASAGATTTDPWRQFGFSINVTPTERAHEVDAAGLAQVGWRSISPGFFRTLGVPVLAGRDFNADDRGGTPPVTILSRALAERLWPGEDPLGKGLYWGEPTGTPKTVIGVVADVRDVSLSDASNDVVYVPHAQLPMPEMTILVATEAPGISAPGLRSAIARGLPGVAVPTIRPLADSRSRALAGPRLHSILLTAFGLAAGALAAFGAYGVASFIVRQRGKEIGLRIALGASRTSVRALVSRQMLPAAVAGITAGLLAALGLGRWIESLLYSVRAHEPYAYVASALFLAATVAAASWFPSRRATRIDARVVLQED